jgi:ribosome-binding ATPase YchF (GTP1/OBG family)
MQIINEELILKDIEFIGKRISDVEGVIKRGTGDVKKAKDELELLKKVH